MVRLEGFQIFFWDLQLYSGDQCLTAWQNKLAETRPAGSRTRRRLELS
jgi:hypothetical protein